MLEPQRCYEPERHAEAYDNGHNVRQGRRIVPEVPPDKLRDVQVLPKGPIRRVVPAPIVT